MREYAVVFARSARKELQALDRGVAGRVLKRFQALKREPRPAGRKKLEGTDNLWRIRVGDWRVVYAVDDAKSAGTVCAPALVRRGYPAPQLHR